jgi:predicted DNA-binding ribbon-helix-helix protein
MKKRSIKISGHATSISMENEFWQSLTEIAAAQKKSISTLITDIDKTRTQQNLSSAIRLFVLRHYKG